MQGRCLSRLITYSVSEILQSTFGIHLLDYQITQNGLIQEHYLGGCVAGDITSCVKVCSHIVSDVPAMKYGHEEADNRILFHINYAIKDENYKKSLFLPIRMYLDLAYFT